MLLVRHLALWSLFIKNRVMVSFLFILCCGDSAAAFPFLCAYLFIVDLFYKCCRYSIDRWFSSIRLPLLCALRAPHPVIVFENQKCISSLRSLSSPSLSLCTSHCSATAAVTATNHKIATTLFSLSILFFGSFSTWTFVRWRSLLLQSPCLLAMFAIWSSWI